jgi:hypothetical protein
MFGDGELKSRAPGRFHVGPALVWTLAKGLAFEIGRTAARRVAGRYDRAIIAARP